MGAFDIKNIGESILNSATGGIGGFITEGLGMALQPFKNKMQLKQQEKLQNLQIKGQKTLADYQTEKQFELWNKTNYPEQINQLNKAGLNPALLYGKGGGGGVTTGSGIATAVTGGQATSGGMGLQAGMGLAQIKLMQAQANNLDADTKKKLGADTDLTIAQTGETNQKIENLKQTLQNDKAKQYLTEAQTASQNIQNAFANRTFEDGVQVIANNAKLGIQNIRKATIEANIAEATEKDQILAIHNQALGTILQNALTSANITNTQTDTRLKEAGIAKTIAETGLTTKQTQAITTQIAQKWTEIGLNKRSLDQTDQKLLIESFKTSMENNGIKPNSPEWTKAIMGFNKYIQDWTRIGINMR